MSGIFELLKIDDDDILHSALEALIEIIRVNLDQMFCYLDDFYQITNYLLGKENLNNRIRSYSIEIWNTIFEEEINNEKYSK
jgi:hypothetical protein